MVRRPCGRAGAIRHATPGRRGQRRLGGEPRPGRDARPFPPHPAPEPRFRQVEPEAERRVAAGGDVCGEHHGLAVLHLPGDPGILPGDPHRGGSLLQLSGLIDRQDRFRIAQPAHDEPLQRLQRRRPVPAVLREQRLYPPRRRVPGRLRQLPARPAVARLSQQRPDIGERRQPRPGLREHPRQQREQLPPQFPRPRPVTYDGTGGRLALQMSHKP